MQASTIRLRHVPADVCCWGNSGKHLLTASILPFDPKQSSSGNVNCWYSTYAPGVRIAAMTQRLARFSYEFEPRVNDQEPIMFDVLMTLLVILSFGFPAMPWFFGARWGLRGVWLSTGFAVVILLCFFPILFWVACGACGQGAIAIFVL